MFYGKIKVIQRRISMENNVNDLNDSSGLADLLGLKKNTFSGLPPKQNDQENPVGNILRIIGVTLFLIGLFIAMVIGVSEDFPKELKSTVVIFTLFSSTIQGALFYGLSEVIYLLTGIRNKN